MDCMPRVWNLLYTRQISRRRRGWDGIEVARVFPILKMDALQDLARKHWMLIGYLMVLYPLARTSSKCYTNWPSRIDSALTMTWFFSPISNPILTETKSTISVNSKPMMQTKTKCVWTTFAMPWVALPCMAWQSRTTSRKSTSTKERKYSSSRDLSTKMLKSSPKKWNSKKSKKMTMKTFHRARGKVKNLMQTVTIAIKKTKKRQIMSCKIILPPQKITKKLS